MNHVTRIRKDIR